jgi:hypothetical protein
MVTNVSEGLITFIFREEDGSDEFLRNVGKHLQYFVVKRLARLLRIRAVPISNCHPETGYPD